MRAAPVPWLLRERRHPGPASEALQERVTGLGGRFLRVLVIAFAAQPGVDVDVLFERERGIEHGLDARGSMLLDRGADLARVSGRLFDDVIADLRGACTEQQVVGGEIGMTEHVRSDQYVAASLQLRSDPHVPVRQHARERVLQ